MKDLSLLTTTDLLPIKMIFFDADGVTKRKGTDFEKLEDTWVMKTWGLTEVMKSGLEKLRQYYILCITSGRSMSYLLDVYGTLVSNRFYLQSEIGMFCYKDGKNSSTCDLTSEETSVFGEIRLGLKRVLAIEGVKGFEPKERIITLHCRHEIPEVLAVMAEADPRGLMHCWWNGEAYDILPKRVDKGVGEEWLSQRLGIKLSEVMIVGNGINDQEQGKKVGISVTTDPDHLVADFEVRGEERGGEALVRQILRLRA